MVIIGKTGLHSKTDWEASCYILLDFWIDKQSEGIMQSNQGKTEVIIRVVYSLKYPSSAFLTWWLNSEVSKAYVV